MNVPDLVRQGVLVLSVKGGLQHVRDSHQGTLAVLLALWEGQPLVNSPDNLATGFSPEFQRARILGTEWGSGRG